jgi:hypothetical protein
MSTAKKFITYEKPDNTGRPRDGVEKKESSSIRLEPRFKKRIVERFGSVQKFLDFMVRKEIGK